MDKTDEQGNVNIICCDCGTEFFLEKNEAAWYEEKFGFGSLPRRCKPCRQELRRKQRNERERAREVQHDQPR